MQRSFRSTFSSLGTIVAQIFRTFKSLGMIFKHCNVQLFCHHSNSKLRLPHTTYLAHTRLTSVQLVEGIQLLESSFTSFFSRSALNLLCLAKARMCDTIWSSYISWSISSACDSFPLTGLQISGLFIAQCSFVILTRSRTTRKKEVKTKAFFLNAMFKEN